VGAVDRSTGRNEDWMLFFSKAARERLWVAEEEHSSRINKWASEVSHDQNILTALLFVEFVSLTCFLTEMAHQTT
jgi:hypothetical protein